MNKPKQTPAEQVGNSTKYPATPETKPATKPEESAALAGLWRRFLARIRNIFSTFWFVPALCILAGLIASQVLLVLDRSIEIGPSVPVFGWVTDVGVDGARSMLSAIGTAMLGVAATAFSITISVIATASSSYGPRLVRNFMADRGNQVVLGVLCSTFIYALLVLRTIHTEDDSHEAFVPQLSVTVAVLLALIDVALVVWFIHHIADSVQVNTIAEGVRTRWIDSIKRWFPKEYGQHLGLRSEYRTPDPSSAATLTADKIGYLVEVDFSTLADLANEHDLQIEALKRVGDHVVSGEPLARVWPADSLGEFRPILARQFSIDDSRTTYQDLRFAQQQVVELAVRGLSPGTNDPYTAVNSIHELGGGVTLAVSRPTAADVILREGKARLWFSPVTQREIIEMPFDHIRPFATQAVIVCEALIDLGRRAQAATIHPELVGLVDDKISQLLRQLRDGQVNPCDLARVEAYVESSRPRGATSFVQLNEDGAAR